MHGIYEHEPLTDAAPLDGRLYLTGDIEVGTPRLRLEPELFTIGFHGRQSVGVHSAELKTQDASRTICPPAHSVNQLLSEYNNAMSRRKDDHALMPAKAPAASPFSSCRHHPPWSLSDQEGCGNDRRDARATTLACRDRQRAS